MAKSTFEELYKNLNTEQKQAVDAIEGPVMVIAGPGTGKTSILTLRIANILQKTDASADSILALTFTESGVHSMRRKLVDIIGPAGYRVNIHTFHSFCNEIIKKYPQEFPRIIGNQNMSDLDQIAIIEDILTQTKLKNLKPYGNPLFYLKSIISQIKELKRDDITPENFKVLLGDWRQDFESIDDLFHEKGAYKGEMKGKYKPLERKIQNSEELAVVYEKYQAALEKKRLYDYEDMIMEVLRELRSNKNLLLELQENYQYILADEHQDANNAQNKLLELLSGFHESPNLFIVGDEKQAIFRFQGASLENFLYFKRRFRDATLITLKKNYRSTQNILDASHSLISKNPVALEDLRVRLESHGAISKKGDFPPLSIIELDTEKAESHYVVAEIKKKIESGATPHSMAILYRDNRDAFLFKRACEALGVPYIIHSDTDLLADDDIRALVTTLTAINDFGNDTLLAPVLFFDFLKLDHLDVFKVLRFARQNKISIHDVLRSEKNLKDARVTNIETFLNVYKKLHELSHVAKKKNLIETFETILERIDFTAHLILQENAREKLALLNMLLGQIVGLVERHKYYALKDYIEFLDMLSKHEISVRASGFRSEPGRVNLMTAHKSKGLEFDHVYCVGMTDGHWGNRKMPNYFVRSTKPADEAAHDIEDERRLLYVAITRARMETVLTYAKRNDMGRDLLPSQLLSEIDEMVERRVIEGNNFGGNGEKSGSNNSGTHASAVIDREYLRQIFLEEGLSVSALNNYLDCAWKYFFINLIRVPKAEEKHQLYGTAVHETLKVFFDAYRIDQSISKKDFISLFESFLNKKALSDEDFQATLEKGKESLSGYYDFYKNSWPKPILNELNVAGVYVPFVDSEGVTHDTLLKGNLDKLEEGGETGFTVVDYKTGSPKSRKEIEGDTKSSDGNYKRQLVFYKILLDRYENGRYKVENGTLDFIEPDKKSKKGMYKKETFTLTSQEADELAAQIATVSAEIYDLVFWNKNCDDKKCEFCRLSKYIVERKSRL